MTKKLYKRIDDISNRVDAITSNITSQDSAESDTNTIVEVESETEPTNTPTSSTTSSSTEPTPTPTPAPTTPSSTEPTSTNAITNTETDLDLLACVIYQEAGGNGSCDDCRRRVADVVLNRVADPRFPNTIREVLTARNQYGRFYYTGVVWPSRSKNVNEQAAVARAYRIAEEVLNGQHSELYGNGYIWQAAFKQGTSQIYCCGEYFGK